MHNHVSTLRQSSFAILVLIGTVLAHAQPIVQPVELNQTLTPFNLQSQRGVPISTTVNTNIGSDGRMSATNDSFGSVLAPTTNQFRGLLPYGGVPGLTLSNWQAVRNSSILSNGTASSFATAAAEMKLPVGYSNNGTGLAMALRRAQIGTPFFARAVSFSYGEVVPVPETDEFGNSLTNIAAAAYWLPEPFTLNNHSNAAYYYSRHAQKVYAIQPGPMNIRWVKAQYITTNPLSPDYITNNGVYFRTYTGNYTVSGAAVKPPRRIYWTYGDFAALGKPVTVPTARVGAINIVFNSIFPSTVPTEYSDGTPNANTNNTFQELRTLWYEPTENLLKAYNREGRAFVEILGDPRADGQTREPLGFEIVDVQKYPTPVDVAIDLGERITPSDPADLAAWTPEPILQGGLSPFGYQHVSAGALHLYAAAETVNQNDYQVHWMELGEVGLKWPAQFARYQLGWPTDVGRYSHYVRPPAASDDEARATAVPLPTLNVPTIQYQDQFGDGDRAKLTETFALYTRLDGAHPAHRTLLRYNVGGFVAFERVFSWLDQSLLAMEPTITAATLPYSQVTTNGSFTNLNGAVTLFISGSIAYVASRDSDSLIIMDVSDPANPVVLKTLVDGVGGFTNLNSVESVFVSGNIAYVAAFADNALNIIDVSDPANPVLLTNLVDGVGGFNRLGGAFSVHVANNIAYVAATTDGALTLIDVSDPANPVLLSEVVDGVGGFNQLNDASSVFVSGTTAYVAARAADALTIIDVSNPYAPVLLKELVDEQGGFNRLNGALSVFVNGTVAYVAAVDDNAVNIIDVSRPDSPVKLKTLVNGVGGLNNFSQPTAVFVADDVLYVTAYGSGSVSMFDVRNPSNPVLLQQVVQNQGGFTRLAGANAVFVSGTSAYVVATVSDALTIFSPPLRALTAGGLATSVAAHLDSYVTNGTFYWPNPLQIPRVVQQTVNVGDRIAPPAGEPTIVNSALHPAGYIRQAAGTLFNPGAYLDPFVAGFSAATAGAIIPVNAVPGTNNLEVWWFRPNGANTQQGFTKTYWPSAIGYYDIQWPANPREIVLASMKGSEGDGPLSSLAAVGTIYYQNNPALPGYNPNEEHAIMSGGTAFATRDDLNITNGVGYSSHPFVLVNYTEADGRPAMIPFQVLREKPEAGWLFDYITEAGKLLQAPMPLPLLAKPVEGSGDNAVNYNTEPAGGGGDLPGNWATSGGAGSAFAHYNKFTYQDRKRDFWVYRGLHAGLPALQAGCYSFDANTYSTNLVATGLVGSAFAFNVHASRQDEFLGVTLSNAPAWLTASGLKLIGTPDAVGTSVVRVVVSDLYDQSSATLFITQRVLAAGTVIGQGPLVVSSTNSFTGTVIGFSNRPPFLARSPNPSNSFTMRYYYKTEPSFAFPGMANPPAAGSIVPYLRPFDSTNEVFVGDGADKDTDALDIVYRPVWPVLDGTAPLAVMPFGYTLTLPQFGLPGVRDWKTAQVLYQQSVAADLTTAKDSVVLHDPTREKAAAFAPHNLAALPGSVRAELYQGKYFFPNLPPHLGQRVFYDPARGAGGSLVLQGQYKVEVFPDNYLQLNVLRGSDLAAVEDLCPAGDSENRPKWVALVNALATDVETFHENPSVPGAFIPNPALTDSVGVQDLAVVLSDNTAVDSYALSATGPGSGYITLVEAGGGAFTEPGDPVALHIIRVGGSLYPGTMKVIPAANPLSEQVTFQHTPDLAGRFDEYDYEWKIAAPVDGLPPEVDATMSRYLALTSGTDIPRYLLGGSGIQVLGDNYITVRYRPVNTNHPLHNVWSSWTTPALAEGWIKRVLAGINPFNQRTSDLFNNAANTDASILTAAGKRWEGDIALNIDTINNYGLIEIYETVLRRGRGISIESGYNYGPANDALLLAAGYLNDLYMMIGNEAFADAANPTIGIGTADNTYGSIATALFAFRGQVPSLLEEELALIRGRDDFLLPGVNVAPTYNRMVWNYTRGIDAGEVIYALNYNIQEDPNANPDGVVNAADAARMFPQGHGDAYGHYLTALKGYYSLFMDTDFDWVPRIEAVSVLGQAVSVDYTDERKFAAAAAALGRAGQQAFDLTWRKDYQPGHDTGWSHFATTRVNTQRGTTRYWGLDHWASRVGQADYVNWICGNAILPAVDPNPLHEGIQKIDRTTVPELTELATMAGDLQVAMDNAEGALTPLGLPVGSVALDINPNVVVGSENGTHFEQIYGRAKTALNNAVVAFDDAKNVTALMRSEQDSLVGIQAAVAKQEAAYNNALIELYGTPYTDDIGPGKTYKQGYAGPDLVHYFYVENPESRFGNGLPAVTAPVSYKVDIQQFPAYWTPDFLATTFNFYVPPTSLLYATNSTTVPFVGQTGPHYIEFILDPHDFHKKPATWAGRRVSPGQIQQAISEVVAAHAALEQELISAQDASGAFARQVALFKSYVETSDAIDALNYDILVSQQILQSAQLANSAYGAVNDYLDSLEETITEGVIDGLPKTTIIGTAVGGDATSVARATIKLAEAASYSVRQTIKIAADFAVTALEYSTTTANQWVEFNQIGALEFDQDLKQRVVELTAGLGEVQGHYGPINGSLRKLDDAQRKLDGLVAKGDRIQQEREVARQRTGAVVQGYRTRETAFRIFRNEKLERYKTLFDLSARYAFLAANAYDYETGLLNTSAGRSFTTRFISSRALGVVQNGEPQFAGSNAGDPGLSSALAEMKADWDVVKGRLGFNNPDAYGTTVSLRTENFRILPTTNSDLAWQDLLQQSRKRDITTDEDIKRHCLQISRGDGLPVPGIVIEFSTTIANGYNLFGQQLAAGDHAFSPSSFATKIFGVGAALEGYRGMDQPAANGNNGGNSPPDPNTSYLDPLGLAATPYVYLIPVGVDSMRSPPLGDATTIRTFQVDDVAIPLPFNIGASEFGSGGLYLSADSLSEPLFANRKHQAFRPVPDTSFFSPSLYGSGGSLQRSQYTNNRLIGRSAWNSRWKLVIPGHTLLSDPDEGLERFIKTVRDIKLHFVTYSYSGN